MKYLKEKGMSIIEALMATAIVGVGFIAVFQMVHFSVNSINTSGERTKASFLSAMVAEGFIGYRDSVGGVSTDNRDNVYYYAGRARISDTEGVYRPDSDPECMKFSEYYLALTSGVKSTCAPAEDDEGFDLEGNEADADGKLSKPIDHDYTKEQVDLGNVLESGQPILLTYLTEDELETYVDGILGSNYYLIAVTTNSDMFMGASQKYPTPPSQ